MCRKRQFSLGFADGFDHQKALKNNYITTQYLINTVAKEHVRKRYSFRENSSATTSFSFHIKAAG